MTEWYQKWFASEEYLEVYKHRNDADAEKLLSLILSNIQLKPDAKILDTACGAGRHSIRLAEQGYRVTAFDLSNTLLNIGMREAQQKKLNIDFFQSDIRNVKVDKKFDLIINLFTSFGYFETDEENFKFIYDSFDLLNINSYFAFDYLNKNFVVKNLVPFSEKNFGDKKITEKRFIENGRVVKDISIERMGHTKTFTESVRLYDAKTIIKNFTRAGYRVLKNFGNYSGQDYKPEQSERLILILKK